MELSERKFAGRKLRVIFRDDSPLIFAGDSPSYRSIELNLTSEQIKQCELLYIGNNCGNKLYESISKVFFEE